MTGVEGTETKLQETQMQWYAIHVLSGHEKRVKAYLENEIQHAGLGESIARVLIPSEQVLEMRDGKKRVRNKVFYPGYMLVEMVLNKETQHVVLNTPGVTNFVGPANQPQQVREDEIRRILGRVDEIKEKEFVSIPFKIGDPVKVTDGPFREFTGFVEDINEEKKKVKVMVSIFGRTTPVELDVLQVETEK